jgi:hypothetical protein
MWDMAAREAERPSLAEAEATWFEDMLSPLSCGARCSVWMLSGALTRDQASLWLERRLGVGIGGVCMMVGGRRWARGEGRFSMMLAVQEDG